MMSLPLVKYVLTGAVRDKLILSLLVLLAVGVSLAIFMGSAAFVEKDKFTVVFAGGGLRMAGVLGLVLFVVFYVRRSFESRDVEFLLSRPIGRVQFLLSLAAAFSILAVLLGLAEGAALLALRPNGFGEGYMLWVISVIAENIIIVNTALFFSMILTSSATAAMVTFAFYVLARMMGQILGIIDGIGHKASMQVLEIIMQGISMVMPRLDLMGQTSWLIFGVDQGANLGFVLMQGFIFTFLILMAAIVDLIRRQF